MDRFECAWHAWMVLNALPEVGPVTLRRLTDEFGDDPDSIFAASDQALLSVKGFGPAMLASFRSWHRNFDLKRELETMERNGSRFLWKGNEHYPSKLRHIYDAPVGLYCCGDSTPDGSAPAIAIVGTRMPTFYGQKVARSFARRLASNGWWIVSGLARGIDTAAHEGALDVGGRTVAVMGNGLDIIFPPENLDLYRRIAASGSVLSEFRFGRKADRQTFPMRNRIVSGMVDAVLVVESDVKGGSMITARFASEQGRQVYAIPGRIDEESSRGCHQLIRDGAILVSSVEDILEDMRMPLGVRQTEMDLDPKPFPPDLGMDPDEASVWDCFIKEPAWQMDALVERLGLPASAVGVALMRLEIKGRVHKRMDGAHERSV